MTIEEHAVELDKALRSAQRIVCRNFCDASGMGTHRRECVEWTTLLNAPVVVMPTTPEKTTRMELVTTLKLVSAATAEIAKCHRCDSCAMNAESIKASVDDILRVS